MLLLAEFTGWSEAVILSLSADRRNTYISELNRINREKSGESSF